MKHKTTKPKKPKEKRIIAEINPTLLIISMIVSTLIFATIHLIYGPPLTFIAAGLLSFITPPIAYGLQQVATHGKDESNKVIIMVKAMLSLYSKKEVQTTKEDHTKNFVSTNVEHKNVDASATRDPHSTTVEERT